MSKNFYRNKRQCGGESLLVWLLVMPNGLLSYRIIEGNLNADKYIDLLRTTAVPIMKLNYRANLVFQEDNSPVHKAHKVKNFLQTSKIKVLEWPAKSPDLNITEDVWKLLSDLVYEGPRYQNKAPLAERIKDAREKETLSKIYIVNN